MKYHKFQNPDPSTAKFAPIIASEILYKIIPKYINKRIWDFYQLRWDTVLGIDLRHAVVRILSDEMKTLVVAIDKFEKENASDLRNYPWCESDQPQEEGEEWTGNDEQEDAEPE